MDSVTVTAQGSQRLEEHMHGQITPHMHATDLLQTVIITTKVSNSTTQDLQVLASVAACDASELGSQPHRTSQSLACVVILYQHRTIG
jgi:hypothetical protein